MTADLSIVIASIDASRTIGECIRRFEHSCAGLRAELIVVDASRDDSAGWVEARGGTTLVRCAYGTLAPVLWAEGYRRSTGRVVAFTTAHCLAVAGWAQAMTDAIARGASGAGGPLVIAPGSRPLDWAIFFLRYSAFMPATLGDGRIMGEIAGDNAAYARAALDRHADTFADGFWEVDFHRSLRADGGWLAAVPDAQVLFGPSFRLRTIVAHRFAHGRQFGAGRARGGRPRWMLALSAPAVPAILLTRAARRVWQDRASRARFVAALPWFMLLASAWAAGEAWGGLLD